MSSNLIYTNKVDMEYTNMLRDMRMLDTWGNDKFETKFGIYLENVSYIVDISGSGEIM